MGLFSRNRGGPGASGVRLPPNFAQILDHYGRWEFDPQGCGLEPPQMGGQPLEAALYFLAQPDPDAFIRAVAAVALPAGGWAVYGGARAVWNAVGTDVQHPDYLAMLDGAIDVVLSQGYSTAHLSPYEMRRWSETRGHSEAR